MPPDAPHTPCASTAPSRGHDAGPIRVALAGLHGVGEAYARALRADRAYEIVALGDERGDVRSLQDDAGGPAVFEDYRLMLVETVRSGLDLLVVALEPFEARDLIEHAARSGVAVLHKTPFARSTAEARERIACFAAQEAPFLAPRMWHYEPAYSGLRRLAELIGPVHAVAATVSTCDLPTGWLGDRQRAGGGVLLNGAYACVDLLIETLGIPERVHAESTRITSASGPHPYDTEDAVVVSFRFPKACVGSLAAVRGAPEAYWAVTFYGSRGTVRVASDGWMWREHQSGRSETRSIDVADPVAAAIRAFAERHGGMSRDALTPASEHLDTLAAVDAAYLSMRTGAPESPAQFLV